MPFRSMALALAISVALTGDLACQPVRIPQVIAEELATMYMLESLAGVPGDVRVNSMHYREPQFDPKTLLLLHLPASDPKLHLQYADMQFKAALNVTDFFETTVTITSERLGASLNIENSQSTLEDLELTLNRAFTAESAKKIVALEHEFGSSPQVHSLLQNRLKTRDTILAILNRKPDLLKPFLGRKPLSPELIKSRQQMRALLDAARKER